MDSWILKNEKKQQKSENEITYKKKNTWDNFSCQKEIFFILPFLCDVCICGKWEEKE